MITIGIPTLNGPSRLERALVAIADCTKMEGVRVLVCDDGSSDGALNENRSVIQRCAASLPNLEFIANGGRWGIAKTWNRLVRHYGDASTIALINDDLEVVGHWLEVLTYSLTENPAVGVVGLNSYVALIKKQIENLYPEKSLPHERTPRVEYIESHLMDGGGSLLSAQGPAFAFRKEAFDRVGGFDERYFAYFEELDFGISLRQLGLFSFMASYPIAYHQGGATNSDPANLNASEQMQRSQKLFEEKWGKCIAQIRSENTVTYVRPHLKEWTTQIENWK